MTARQAGGWRYYGQQRPPFAVAPGPGEESVWDYPRPPRIEPVQREVVVRAGRVEIARTRRALRVLETASPPTVYIPRANVATAHLQPVPGGSTCEWKGMARYWTVATPWLRLESVGWSYDDPLGVTAAFNKNLLVRLNRELGANFDLAAFDHRALWNAQRSRVEMHLVSRTSQRVLIPGADLAVAFDAGESIWTESSNKYTPAKIAELAAGAGFSVRGNWVDDDAGVALSLMQATSTSAEFPASSPSTQRSRG